MRHLMIITGLLFILAGGLLAQQPGHRGKMPGMVKPGMMRRHNPAGMNGMGKKTPLVPNYMRVVVMQGDLLNLTKEQNAKLEEWRSAHHADMQKLKEEIKAKKKSLFEASMKGASSDELIHLLNEKNKLEQKMVENKTECRDFLREVLTEEQWNKLLDAYGKM